MKHLDDPARMEKELYKRVYLLAIIPITYSLLSGEMETLLGFVVGLVISTLLFRLKLIHISRALEMSEARATTFIRNRYFITYVIYFAVLYTAYKNPALNFVAAVVGLFLLKFTVLGWMGLDLIKSSWQKRIDELE